MRRRKEMLQRCGYCCTRPGAVFDPCTTAAVDNDASGGWRGSLLPATLCSVAGTKATYREHTFANRKEENCGTDRSHQMRIWLIQTNEHLPYFHSYAIMQYTVRLL